MSNQKDYKLPATFNPELIVWARLNEGVCLADAADALGISEDQLRAYERGDELPMWSFILKAAKAYRRPAGLFLADKPPKDMRRYIVRIVAHYSDGTEEVFYEEQPDQE